MLETISRLDHKLTKNKHRTRDRLKLNSEISISQNGGASNPYIWRSHEKKQTNRKRTKMNNT